MDRQVDIDNMALFWQSMSSLVSTMAGIHRDPCIGLIQITKLYNAQGAFFFADVTLGHSVQTWQAKKLLDRCRNRTCKLRFAFCGSIPATVNQFFSFFSKNQTPEFNTTTCKRCRFLFKGDTSLVKIMNESPAGSCTRSLKILYKLDQVEDPSRILFKILCREWW